MGKVPLHHTAIVVSDMDRSLAFYQAVFGLTPEKRVQIPESGLELAFLSMRGTRIELLCYHREGEKPPPGLVDHVAIGVDDTGRLVERLVQEGIVPAGSTPRRGPGGSSNFFFRGPDGEKLELFEDPDDK